MSEVRLVLLDAEREISGTCHGSTADRIIAALSAEPETIEELEAACARFERPSEHRLLAWFRPGVNDEPYDAGLVVIDLAARLIACDSTYSSASHQGSVSYHNGECATDVYVNYRLPNDWRVIDEAWNWRPYSESRRRDRMANPPLDARAVLYGRPLLEFIARSCFQAFHGQTRENLKATNDSESADESDWHGFDDEGPRRTESEQSAVRDIHARWLLASQAGLNDQAPRQILHGRRSFIELDLQDREFQWTKQEHCPPGLSNGSHAYRFAGFGRHEIVVYYYLVRRLLWLCRDRVAEMLVNPQAAMMTVGDFLVTEIDRLVQFRDECLDTPDPEYHGRTPRSIIERERQRLPEGMSGEDAIIDHDCPLCQMMADDLGPTFWHLDGCNMDDEFAFSFDATREAWEANQREWEEFNRKFNAEQEERERLGVKHPGSGYSDPDYSWDRSFVANQCDGMPLELRLFGIGSNLAELVVALKQPTENRQLIDRLSRDFGNLREVARSENLASGSALAEPVINRFCDTLADTAAAREDLREQCDELSLRLQRFFEPPSERNEFDFGNDDSPF